MSSHAAHSKDIISTTQHWLAQAVIGLNLCPFAKAVYTKNKIRYFVSQATTPEALASDLLNELHALNETTSNEIDTTLIIHPFTLNDFLDYNDFLDVANAILLEEQLEEDFQIASFHPDYQFANTQASDIENYTNRSPYPILHILREDSVSKAVAAFPDADSIFEKNIATMQQLGHEGWDNLGLNTIKKEE